MKTNIDAYLHTSYLPPYGTTLSPSSFIRNMNGPWRGWQVTAHNADGDLVDYSLVYVGSKRAKLFADGVEVPYRDPHTKRLSGSNIARVSEWYDYILQEDAKGNTADQQPEWSGDDFASVLHRLDNSVVIKGAEEENVDNFASLADLQKWVDRQLAGTQARATAYQLGDFYPAKKDPELTSPPGSLVLTSRHWHPEEEPPVGTVLDGSEANKKYCFVIFHSDIAPADTEGFKYNWLENIQPWASLVIEGSQIIGYCSDFEISFSDLQEAAPLSKEPSQPRSTWWVLHMEGTDLALVFPSTGYNLIVSSEHDRARITFEASPTRHREELNQANDNYEREWGKWLDPSVVLSDAELQEGIDRALALVQ